MEKKSSSNSLSRLAFLALAILSFVITFCIYIPGLFNDFQPWWDDQWYVVYNTHIRDGFSWAFLKWVFTNPYFSNWHPLTIMSYALDYSIWELDPFGYHLTNNILHSLNAALVFTLAAMLIKISGINTMKWIAAFTAAILFGVHPQHVESVAWIAERKDVLFTAFFLLSIIAYLKYASSSLPVRKLYYAISLGSFILSIMSKPMAVTLPAVLLILDYYPLKKPALQPRSIISLLIEKIPFFAISAAAAYIAILSQDRALVPTDVYPFAWRIVLSAWAYMFYLYKMMLPLGLVPFYARPEQIDLYSFKYLGTIVLFMALTVIAMARIKKKRGFTTLWAYYIVTLLPVSGLVLVGAQAAADRYIYMPSIGFMLFVGILIGLLPYRFQKKGFAVAVILVVMASVTLIMLTVRQIGFWKDNITLWSRQIDVAPIAKGYSNRADDYVKKGLFNKAIADYTAIIDMTIPDTPQNAYKVSIAHSLRGDCYKAVGDHNRAIEEYETAIMLNPDNFAALNNMGNAYMELSRVDKSVESFLRAIEIAPDKPAMYFNLARAYERMQEDQKALWYYEKASRMGFKEANERLGSIRNISPDGLNK